VSLAVFLLDPPSIGVVDPALRSFVSDKQSNTVSNNLPNTYAGVAGNVTLLVLANPQGTYQLKVADVAPLVRGGVVYFGSGAPQITLLTEQMRGGQDSFSFQFGTPSLPPPPPPPPIPDDPPATLAAPATSQIPDGNTQIVPQPTIQNTAVLAGAATENRTGSGGDDDADQSPRTTWEWLANGLLQLWSEIRRRLRASLPFKLGLLGGMLDSAVSTTRRPLDKVALNHPSSDDLAEAEGVESVTPPVNDGERQPVHSEGVEARTSAVIDSAPHLQEPDLSATVKSGDAEGDKREESP